ncbi:MAG: hypothetical protein JWN52_737 [Actinomycetia bacterium]|nr:hypothetical protein [Actinomycetes bacterium]
MGQMVLDRSEAADDAVLHLPESGCEVRAGRATHGRPALEVYAGGSLYDVAVAGGLGSGLIRGAVRGRGRGRRWSLAWGELPPGRNEVTVVFRSGRRVRPAACRVVAGRFWVAETAGGFRSVQVADGASTSSTRLGRRALRG